MRKARHIQFMTILIILLVGGIGVACWFHELYAAIGGFIAAVLAGLQIRVLTMVS